MDWIVSNMRRYGSTGIFWVFTTILQHIHSLKMPSSPSSSGFQSSIFQIDWLMCLPSVSDLPDTGQESPLLLWVAPSFTKHALKDTALEMCPFVMSQKGKWHLCQQPPDMSLVHLVFVHFQRKSQQAITLGRKPKISCFLLLFILFILLFIDFFFLI